MTALEAFHSRLEQYRLHQALLGIDEINFYKQELDLDALDAEGRELLERSERDYEKQEEETWRSLEESGLALEASARLNRELEEAKGSLESKRDELQSAYEQLEDQKDALEQQNHELVATKERLEEAKRLADREYDEALERLRIQEQLNMMADKVKGQRELLSRQNWLGAFVVVGTGGLFAVTKEQIIAGAFVTLTSMYLQTMSGSFSSFFGGAFDQQKQRPGREK